MLNPATVASSGYTGLARVVFRPTKGILLGRPERKYEGALRARPRCEHSRELEDRGDSGAVIHRSVVNPCHRARPVLRRQGDPNGRRDRIVSLGRAVRAGRPSTFLERIVCSSHAISCAEKVALPSVTGLNSRVWARRLKRLEVLAGGSEKTNRVVALNPRFEQRMYFGRIRRARCRTLCWCWSS